MMPAPSFRYSRVIDLSLPLIADPDQHPWVRYEVELESIIDDPDSAPPSGRWYVVTRIAMGGHAGTHVEAPLHAEAHGPSAGDLPVERFFGETVILDLRDAAWSEPVELPRLKAAARRAGGVRPDDIAFLHFDWEGRSAAGGNPPYPAPEALSWLVGEGIKLLGIDSPGLEVPGNRALVNHHILFDRGIPLIESLANLAELRAPRVYVFAQPLPADGADAVPLRILAFEGVPDE